MAYQVKLPIFEGPFDLLFHLIEEQKVNIYDIPIATITGQYLDYLRLMDLLDLEVTTGFLVMAATLLEIKSRLLLPRAEPEVVEEVEFSEDGMPLDDARRPLVEKLIEYRRYKLVALALRERERAASRIFVRQNTLDPQPIERLDIELTAYDLVNLYRGLVQRRRNPPTHRVVLDRINLSRRIEQIRHELFRKGGTTRFTELLRDHRNRLDVVISLMAVLEMARMGEVDLEQHGNFKPITVKVLAQQDTRNLHEQVG